MDKFETELDEFEYNMMNARRSQEIIVSGKMQLFFLIFMIVIIALAVPRSFYLIPTRKAQETVSANRDPVQVIIPENLQASKTMNTYALSKLVRLETLNKKEQFYIMPIAKYSIVGRTTAKHKFYFMPSLFDKFQMVDIGLVWGDMANDKNFNMLEQVSYVDDDGSKVLITEFAPRFKKENAGRVSYLDSHYSQIHAIPANKKIMSALKSVRHGQKVKLEGYLVDVYNSNQRRYATTSISRTDNKRSARGGNPCEIMYVLRVQIGKKVFE